MNIFKKKYYYLESTNKETGRPIIFGALRNRGSNGKIGEGSYCKNESEASRAAGELLKGRVFEIKMASTPKLSDATREWKGGKLKSTGDIEEASRRVGHQIEDKRNKKGDEDSLSDYEYDSEELKDI